MVDEQHGLTAEELDTARRLVRPLIEALRGQGGSSPVVSIDSDTGVRSLTASHVRKLRRALWRPSPDLADMNRLMRYGPRSTGLRARRAALRSAEYPEPAE